MKEKITKLLENYFLNNNELSKFNISRNLNNDYGNFSSNIAMVSARSLKKSPLVIGEEIKEYLLKNSDFITKVDVVKPGFVNIFLNDNYHSEVVKEIIFKKNDYGKREIYNAYNLEFVSANPTGFLHVAHARNAALGDTISNIWDHRGIRTIREYYINDAGNQMNTAAYSIYQRYLELYGKTPDLEGNDLYRGTDIIYFAKIIKEQIGDKWLNQDFKSIKEEIKKVSVPLIMKKIKSDLLKMGVKFDVYSSESDLLKGDIIKKLLKSLKGVYEKDGAIWLKTTDNGDDKDRALVKSDGSFTYFLPDISYHLDKLSSDSVTKVINIWGADHLGYIKRMEIALALSGCEGVLDVIVLQIVKLIKGGKELKMSKRMGTSFYMEDLINEVGKDTARFFLINRTNNSNLEFDLDLASLKSNDNPVFIVKYSHARAIQLINKSTEVAFENITFYDKKQKDLINTLESFPELLENIAITYKVHLLPQFLITIAKKFNSIYSNTKIIGAENENSLIALTKAFQLVMKLGLTLIGVEAPDKM